VVKPKLFISLNFILAPLSKDLLKYLIDEYGEVVFSVIELNLFDFILN